MGADTSLSSCELGLSRLPSQHIRVYATRSQLALCAVPETDLIGELLISTNNLLARFSVENREGQLDDRRAISVSGADVLKSSLLSRPDHDTTYEFQLKGADRTPFSGGADGLAVLRSSIRQRILSFLSPMPVTSRSGSHVCVGYFYHPVSGNARPTRMTWEGMCNNESRGSHHADSGMPTTRLSESSEWTVKRAPKRDNVNLAASDPWGKELVLEVAQKKRQDGCSIAGIWIHARRHQYGQTTPQVIASRGYLIPDSVSITGLTIDYGLYAFMDVFDPQHKCNLRPRRSVCFQHRRTLRGTPEPELLDTGKATEEWLAWLDIYAARIESEKTSGEWGEDFDQARGNGRDGRKPSLRAEAVVV
ncbi:hypothetical protein EDD15DRAFT_2203016 [Pisolithus albus]|nr:hypothetical protein EDD15DRAFT_2203016 [Pisolithus albus]